MPSLHRKKTTNTKGYPNKTINAPPDGFLVQSPGCKIPEVDPFAEDAMNIFQRGIVAETLFLMQIRCVCISNGLLIVLIFFSNASSG